MTPIEAVAVILGSFAIGAAIGRLTARAADARDRWFARRAPNRLSPVAVTSSAHARFVSEGDNGSMTFEVVGEPQVLRFAGIDAQADSVHVVIGSAAGSLRSVAIHSLCADEVDTYAPGDAQPPRDQE